MADLWAHTSQIVADKETLDAHSRNVASHAQRLGAKFNADDIAFAAGMLHDLGKAKPTFQAYLRKERGSAPHSADGALYAVKAFDGAKTLDESENRRLGRVLAFAIAGHHAGLANGLDYGASTLPLNERLQQAELETPKPSLWYDRSELAFREWPKQLSPDPGKSAFAWSFFTRMLFSTLVDADFIETERWFAKVERGETIARGWTGRANGSLEPLRDALDARLAEFVNPKSDIDHLRAEVLADCRAAAVQNAPSHFTLTVPTGGGKTLSSLAFGLDHAIKHGLDRVIYVIPFTSIVEQTATEFRNALKDDDAILEHHSAFDFEQLIKDKEDAQDGTKQIQRAAENWDRPIIVTTAVQFFESLFANRTSRCRKLHNIARSVIVLDEAQTLPVPLMRPCLAALKELVRGYRASVVLCTATQPAVTKEVCSEASNDKPPEEFIDQVVDIVPKGRNLFKRLKRVRWQDGGTMSDGDVVEALANTDAGLVIVNTRRHARELFEHLEREGIAGARHLTTAMTAAHRQHVLAEIRTHLDPKHQDRRPVRLVATSLIEAGVDISFQAVWRAWAGLDQIAQAAGRCNRGGELGPEGGLLTIFKPEPGEGRGPPRELKANAEAAKRIVGKNFEPLSPEGTAAYFADLLWTKSDGGRWRALDNNEVGDRGPGIMRALDDTAQGLDFPFADIAEAFRIIKDTMVPIIIPAKINACAGASDEIIGKIYAVAQRTKSGGKSTGLGGILRNLQRHVVQVPKQVRADMLGASAKAIEPSHFGEQFVILTSDELYSDEAGLRMDDLAWRSAGSNVM